MMTDIQIVNQVNNEVVVEIPLRQMGNSPLPREREKIMFARIIYEVRSILHDYHHAKIIIYVVRKTV